MTSRSSGMGVNAIGAARIFLSRAIAQSTLNDPAIKRLITITGVNLTVAAGLLAAIGAIGRFKSPQKLVSYFGLNPRGRHSVLLITGGSAKSGAATPGRCWSMGGCEDARTPSSSGSGAAIRSPPARAS